MKLKQRQATIMAGFLEWMAEANVASSTLESARTKLLLRPVPRGVNVRCELARKFELCRASSFEEFLNRAEN